MIRCGRLVSLKSSHGVARLPLHSSRLRSRYLLNFLLFIQSWLRGLMRRSRLFQL